MITDGVSDLYLTVGRAVVSYAVEAGLYTVGDVLSESDMAALLASFLHPDQITRFQEERELNTSIDRGVNGRFRVNIMRQKNNPAIVIRHVLSQIPDFESLGLPPLFRGLSMAKRGLILVTGVTASGKSTTLASMLDYRNQHDRGHIITIEDPIEYFHDHKESVVSQREVGIDTESFAAALKNALRQRPDVILIGEIRDRTVMEHALTIAETGHLALATLHTTNAYQTIERVINFFPEEQAAQIRLNLALNLRAIVSQRLVPSVDGHLVLAQEVLLNDGLVKELILNGEILKIRELLEQNRAMGMCSFDQSLLDLYTEGRITEEVALSYSDRPGDLKIKIKNYAINQREGKFNLMDTGDLRISD